MKRKLALLVAAFLLAGSCPAEVIEADLRIVCGGESACAAAI